LWGGKPAEAKAETTSLPSTETTVPQPAEVPLPPRRNEASTAVAKPRDANGKPQNSVAAPAPVKPQAAASPAGAATKVAALPRAGVSTFAQADH
ncbi:MAG: hypothetical protein WA231_06270, partial [Methylocella sp.]